MTFILILFIGYIPADFIGPLPFWQPSPTAPRIYYEGPSLVLPQPPSDGWDHLIVQTNYPAMPHAAKRPAGPQEP